MEKENTIMLEENKDDLQKCAASDLSKVSVDIYKQDIDKNEDPEKVAEYTELRDLKSGLIPGPKRKMALLVAYCGENYYGLQMNRSDQSLKTIEREFFLAVAKSKLVLPNCATEPSKMSYKCASRTDKGVSTCGLIVSLKMVHHDDIPALINKHLPSDIRVFGAKRTTKHFNAQKKASGRTYTYTCPTFAFNNSPDFSYRINDEKLSRVNGLLQRYIGTHSFHNFTSGKTMGEMSANRYIINFTHTEPFLHNNIEFVTFKLKGQSFMIHQIRKMMGLVISIASGHAPPQHMDRAFNMARADVPIAPGHGLVLEQVHFDAYNKEYSKIYGSLDFDECSGMRTDFLRTKIMPTIYRKEIEENSMKSWWETLKNHDFTEEGGYNNKRLQQPKRTIATTEEHLLDQTLPKKQKSS